MRYTPMRPAPTLAKCDTTDGVLFGDQDLEYHNRTGFEQWMLVFFHRGIEKRLRRIAFWP